MRAPVHLVLPVLVTLVTLGCAGPGATDAAPVGAAHAADAADAAFAAPPTWGGLVPGPRAVGFRAAWILDPERTLRTAWDDGATWGGSDGAPRPILVQLWYPADPAPGSRPMPHGDYLVLPREVPPPHGEPREASPPGPPSPGAASRELPDIAPFAAALEDHARGIVSEELLGLPPDELDATGRARLQGLLGLPTAAHRDAAPLPGSWPLVLYHSGAGSSFEDNAAFGEHLASWGFVVVGSAFPEGDGESLGIDAADDSARDLDRLAAWAAGQPFVDGTRVALAGHSLGAQAVLRAAGRAAPPPDAVRPDAVVLLDTTQDNYALSVRLYERFVDPVLDARERLALPLLVTAGPDAQFALMDRLARCDRTYLTLPALDHDEFIAQGLLRLEGLRRAAADGDIDARATLDGLDLDAILADHRALGEFTRWFLVAHLIGDDPARVAFERACDRAGTSRLGEPVPHVERAPVGVTGPPAWDPRSATPPTPRQLRRLLDDGRVGVAVQALHRFAGLEPPAPITRSTMLLGSLLYDLVVSGRHDAARAFHAAVREVQPRALGLILFLADFGELLGRPEAAREALDVALFLEPDRADLAERRRALDSERD